MEILGIPIFEGDIIKVRYKKRFYPAKDYIGWVVQPNWISKILKCDLVLEVIPKEMYLDFKSQRVLHIEVLSRNGVHHLKQ